MGCTHVTNRRSNVSPLRGKPTGHTACGLHTTVVTGWLAHNLQSCHMGLIVQYIASTATFQQDSFDLQSMTCAVHSSQCCRSQEDTKLFAASLRVLDSKATPLMVKQLWDVQPQACLCVDKKMIFVCPAVCDLPAKCHKSQGVQ